MEHHQIAMDFVASGGQANGMYYSNNQPSQISFQSYSQPFQSFDTKQDLTKISKSGALAIIGGVMGVALGWFIGGVGAMQFFGVLGVFVGVIIQ